MSPAPSGGRAPWAVLTIDSPAEAEEALVKVLCDGGALGVQSAMEPGPSLPPGRAILHAYVDAGRPMPAAGDLERLCPPARGLRILSSRAVADGRWVERWIASLEPFDVGRRFRIVPVEDSETAGPPPPASGSGRIPLRIVPGRAFGTGEHATTRLCLEALEELDLSGRSLLDVGTGSGILAMAGMALGAGRALGIDIDPEAIRVAAANLRLNPPAAGLELEVAGPASVPGRFDVVVANLNSGILEECLEALVARLAPGGTLILSGLLDVEAGPAAARTAGAGAPARSAREMEGWACIVHGAPGA